MRRAPAQRRGRRSGTVAALAAVPAIALAAAFTPCLCPEHDAHRGAALAAASPGHHAHGAAHATHPDAAQPAPRAQAAHGAGAEVRVAGPAHHAGSSAAQRMAWVVGTPQVPLVLRQDAGALALGDAPPQPVAVAARAAAGTEPVAIRSQLTTAQATAKLSRRCRKLLKAKRPSRLSASDRRRRSSCLRQRRALIAASQAPADEPTPTTPTSTTPAATTPTAGTPTPTPVTTPTPAATPAPCAAPCVRAIGVQALDDATRGFIFTLTRATVEADRVSFQFENKDAQDHNLFVQPKGRPELAEPVSTRLAPGGRVTKELDLAPGTYTLRCVILGHESMTVDITVTAPVR